MKTKETIKMAVVGLGRIGLRHAKACQNTPGLSLAAICEIDDKTRQEAEKELKVPAFRTFEEFLTFAKADWVVIATPSNYHTSMALSAIQHNYNVLVEKPIAKNLEEATQIFSLASKLGKHVTVNQSLRYQADTMYVYDVIRSGKLGEIYQIYRGVANFSERTDWQIWKKNNGGALANWGSHFVDAILHIANGNPTEVFASLRQIQDKGDAEDSFKLLIRFDNGIIGEAEVIKAHYNKAIWHVCGTEGTISIEDKSPLYTIRSKIRNTEEKICQIDFRDEKDKLFKYYDNFSKLLHEGSPPPITPESIIKQLTVLDAARRSQIKNKSISIYPH